MVVCELGPRVGFDCRWVGVTQKLKLLQTAFPWSPHSLGWDAFLRRIPVHYFSLSGGKPKEEGLEVFNLQNLHSWNEDIAQLRSNNTDIPMMEFHWKKRFCSGDAVLVLSQLVTWMPASWA